MKMLGKCLRRKKRKSHLYTTTYVGQKDGKGTSRLSDGKIKCPPKHAMKMLAEHRRKTRRESHFVHWSCKSTVHIVTVERAHY